MLLPKKGGKINITTTILVITDLMKPILIKLLPISFLRKVKSHLVNSSMKKLVTEPNYLPFAREAHADGVNLIGYIQGEIGLGQSCRLVAESLAASKVGFTIYNYSQVSAMRMGDDSWNYKVTNTTPYNINIIHINPYELPLAYFRIGNSVWDRRYNIAFWLWELESFPDEWKLAVNLVDEIWTPSEFVSSSIRKITNKPVRTVPYAVKTPICGTYTRTDFNLPDDKVLFLCMYDCNSTMSRKNPIGAIDAYKQAFFGTDKNVGLVVKVNNSQQSDLDDIKEAISTCSDVFIISEALSKEQVNALIACVDVYVSLHRAEGFGLVPMEAMFLGTPVIATNWSANTEFMNNDVACMVDYTLTSITQDSGPYKAGNRWAEPKIVHAAEYMKKLAVDTGLRDSLAEKARFHVMEHFAPERADRIIRSRIEEIYRKATV